MPGLHKIAEATLTDMGRIIPGTRVTAGIEDQVGVVTQGKKAPEKDDILGKGVQETIAFPVLATEIIGVT